MPKSNRCSSTPKYPRVKTIQEQELEGENKQVYGRKETGKAESLTQQSERAYKGRDCKNGHKFGTSCFILGNQKGYGRQDCTSRSPIRHFVPHPWQSKSEGMDCEMSSANRWIANSALCASSGNQEMAIEREAIM
ncbi:hypothetical protein GLOIN_2v1790354 [Rhizophagus irregularis DAOM 181602=DAOM 197198]|nr:hypothetical protein GLOIN_2v1790354 [Rhizophagus irregularis DAOM 181602=DAOM 197198]